jgi:hypothetical protein
MSAFLCSDLHINTLAAFAKEHNIYVYYNGAVIDNEPQRIAAILYTANVEAINERYRQDGDSSTFTYKPVGVSKIKPVVIIKLCHCFDYQACEVDNYEATVAHFIMQAIIGAACRILPGYEAAPWGI